MRVSAIVPTYNRARLIGRAIESVLSQSYRDLELVVVDDGSTDDSERAILKYAGGATPLRYVRKANGGCASARNLGVQHAAGELIAFLDSDDEWLPDAIRSLVDVLLERGADFVYSPSIERFADGAAFASVPAAAERPEAFAIEHFMTTRARSCSNLYRRTVFDAVRFDETTRYNEDSDFLQRVAIRFKAAYSPAPTAIVHHHPDNKSKDRVAIGRAVLASTESILRDYPDFAKQLGARAEQRRVALRRELAEAHLAIGDVAGARAAAGSYRLGLPLDLWLRVGWSFPIRLRRRIDQARRMVGPLVARMRPAVFR